jgi:hypothetical protein
MWFTARQMGMAIHHYEDLGVEKAMCEAMITILI